MDRPIGISVVIPCFGRLDLLQAAVDSVVTHAPDMVEILVIDDASPLALSDGLGGVNASGVTVRCWRLATNSGPQTARNLGIRRARFQYIAFLDSDDLFAATKVDRVLDIISVSRPDVIFHGLYGLEKYSRLARTWNQKLRKILPFHWLLMLYNPIPTPSLIIKRQRRLGPPGWRYCEDYAFLLHYCRPGMDIVFLDEALGSVRRAVGTSGGLSAALWAMRKGEFRARRLLLRHPHAADYLRFCIGSLIGGLRIISDLVRRRYRSK